MSGRAEGRELPGRLPLQAAREMVLAGVEPLEPVEVPLERAQARVAATPVLTPADVPPFDASAMDGFAVRSADCPAGDGAGLDLVGESSAGAPWQGTLEPGQAVSISTGAELPAGADAVVKVEETTMSGGDVIVAVPVRPGENVRARGEAMAAGSEVLGAGSRIGPVEIGLLASTGNDPVLCHPRPTVAIVATGDELVPPGQALGPGQIWNSNLAVISAMANAAGADLVSTVTVGDSKEQTEAAVEAALAADLAVICGGVSVGDHDHVKGALERLGAERLFWGVAMRPGRPTWFGSRGRSRVLGLPGNPVSAMAVFALLGSPLLKAMAGDRWAAETSSGRLLAPVRRLPDRLLAAPCRVRAAADGVGLEPIVIKGSHDFISLAGARELALIDAGEGEAAAGDEVEMVALAAE